MLSTLPPPQVAAQLVEAAVDAYRRVVANRAKCGALLERMQLLQPAVTQVAALLEEGARAWVICTNLARVRRGGARPRRARRQAAG